MSEEKLQRVDVPAMDEILGQKFKVLDDGFVRVVDYMGSDASIVQAARVSYGNGTKKTSEDRGLIRYLVRNRHTTPLEMCEIKLHVRIPCDAWRQWIRHRTANVNEYSTRYSIAIDSTQKTKIGEWRIQATDNKQGSSGFLDESIGKELTESETELQAAARAVYEKRLAKGVAREQARKDLPLSTYTEAYWKIDLHNLMHFLGLRMESSAQKEIRDYATIIGEQIVAKWVPLAWEAFKDYHLNAINLTALDIQILSLYLKDEKAKVRELMSQWGWLKESGKPSREYNEFIKKLERLGIA